MEANIKEGRKIREQKVKAIAEKLSSADSLVVSDYRGLDVHGISELRRSLAPLGAKLHVQKNKLIKIALSDANYPDEIKGLLVGPTAVAYVAGDLAPVLKELIKYSKKDGVSFEVKGAFFDGVVFDKNATVELSKLPSRDQLIAQLMGVMNAPVRNFAMTMNDVVVRLARAIQAVADSKK